MVRRLVTLTLIGGACLSATCIAGCGAGVSGSRPAKPTPGIGTPVRDRNGVVFEVLGTRLVRPPYLSAPNPPGEVTVVIKIALVNRGTHTVPVTSLGDFKLLGSPGQIYFQVIFGAPTDAPNGSLAPGATMTGEIEYQIPRGRYRLAYTPFDGSPAAPVSIGRIG